MFTAMRSAVAATPNKLHSLPIVKQCPHFFLQLGGPGSGGGRGRGSVSLMCPVIRTPCPPFFKHSICGGPRCRCFIHQTRRKRKGRGGKKEKKKSPRLLFQLDPIRQEVGRDVLALAATSRLIMSPCRAICLTEKLLQNSTSTSTSTGDTGSRKYQEEEF